LREGDLNNIEELEDEIDNAEKKINEASNKKQETQGEINALTLPEKGVPSEILNELKEKLEKLKELQREMKELDDRINKESKQAQEAINRIGEGVDASEWENITLDNIGDLDRFLQEAHQTLSEKRYLNSEKDRLEADLAKEELIHSSKELEEGIKHLSTWLKESQSNYGIQPKWIWSLTGVGVLSILLTFFLSLGAYGWIGVLIGIIALLGISYTVFLQFPSRENSWQQKAYEETNLPAPEKWNNEKVREKLDELTRKLQDVRDIEYKRERITNLNKSIDELEPKLQEINKIYNDWKTQLKAIPNLPEEKDLKNYSELYYFLTYFNEWHQHHSESAKSRSQKEKKQEVYSKEFEIVNKLFKEYNFQQADTIEQANAIYKKIQEEENKRSELKQDIKHYEDNKTSHEDEKQNKKQKLQQVYERLGVNYGKKDEVREYEKKLKDYQDIKQNTDSQQRDLKKVEKELKAHSLYNKFEQDFRNLRPDEIELKKQGLEEEASQLKNIHKEIYQIEADVKSVSKKNDLEKALAEEDRALDELEHLYEENLSSIAGHILVEELKKESREKDKPQVLQKATDLFARITNGAYQLRLGEGEESVFVAYDTQKGIGQSLNRLSTGTRVQLLFAVRLAFIEVQEESSYKLPLLADELLGNSDDQRARAIIEALTEVNKEGRQIFYFTAQGDEVEKWKKFKEENNEIEIREFFLKGQNNEGIAQPNSHNIEPLLLWDED
ncbi:MAG: ATP-binding protein, partial [Flavobacteriales bacterium]